MWPACTFNGKNTKTVKASNKIENIVGLIYCFIYPLNIINKLYKENTSAVGEPGIKAAAGRTIRAFTCNPHNFNY
jgi:hypothetical protein